MSNAMRYCWDEMPVDKPNPLADRRRIMGQNMTIAQVLLRKGFFVESHHHINEQIAIVMSGRIEFVVGDGEDVVTYVLCAGETLHVPPDVPHSARALEDTLIIDVFSPAAEKTGIDSAPSSS